MFWRKLIIIIITCTTQLLHMYVHKRKLEMTVLSTNSQSQE